MEPDDAGGKHARLGEAIERLPIAICLIDADGKFVLLGGALAKYLGPSIPSHEGTSSSWRIIDDEGREVEPSEWPSARALRGETVNGVLGIVTGDGESPRHVRIYSAPFNEADGGVRAITLLQDADCEQRSLNHLQRNLERELVDACASVIGPWREVRGRPLTPAAEGQLRAPSAQSGNSPPLTNREHEVLRLFAWGYSRKQIAARLGIAVKTVEFYQTAGMRKLGARSRVEVVSHAIEMNWLATKP